jgi:putative transposase
MFTVKRKNTNVKNKAYKYRAYPNKQQATLMLKTIGCSRFIYNKLLSDMSSYYKENKEMLKREVSFYKSIEEYSFLKEVDSLALANAKLNLNRAFTNFFEKRSNYPVYKKKGINDSYTTNRIVDKNNNSNIIVGNGYIKLPKIGNVRIKQHRLIGNNETIKSVTVSKKGNKFYLSILVEYEEDIENISKDEITLNNTIGLDYSSTYLYVDSNGNSANYPRYYRVSENKLKKAQRKLSKKVKGSKNYNKQKMKLSKIYQKITNQRSDFLHKLSNQITNDYSLICFEDINLSNMKRCLKLGKATSDNGFGMFRTFCEYKALKKGKYTIKIDKWYASTKTCNNCNYKNDDITLSTKEWICPNCGAINQRDPNAALNIRNEGYRLFMTS